VNNVTLTTKNTQQRLCHNYNAHILNCMVPQNSQIASLVSFIGCLTIGNNRDRWSRGSARRRPFAALELPTWLAWLTFTQR